MRIYKEGLAPMLEEVRCNCCGKELRIQNGLLIEECFHGKNIFGYFSEKDGICEEFDLCESCYQEMVEKFSIAVTQSEVTELL